MRQLSRVYMTQPLVIGAFTGYSLSGDQFKMIIDLEHRLLIVDDIYRVPLEQVLYFIYKDQLLDTKPTAPTIKEDKRSSRNSELVSEQLPGTNSVHKKPRKA